MTISPPDYGLEMLAARAEITDAIHRYCHAADRRRWWLMETVFHDDGTCKLSTIPKSPWRDFVKQAEALFAPIGPTHHQLGNTQIAIDGDVAHVETYITAFHRVLADSTPGGPFGGTGEAHDVIMGGRYIDRFEKRDGVWKIAERASASDFRHYRPVNEGSMGSLRPPPDVDPSIHVIARWQQ